MEGIIFYSLAVITIISALAVVIAKNPIYSACGLVVTFLSLAVLYILLHSEFISVVQVLVYAGGMIVLILFAVFIINLENYEFEIKWHLQTPVAVLIGIILLVEISIIISRVLFGKPSHEFFKGISSVGNTEAIAGLLFSKFLLPFEIASVLLLAAMIGAIVMARREKRR